MNRTINVSNDDEDDNDDDDYYDGVVYNLCPIGGRFVGDVSYRRSKAIL